MRGINGIFKEDEIINAMNKLAEERPLFHSEADYQHALGWKIRNLYPSARIRAEVKKLVP